MPWTPRSSQSAHLFLCSAVAAAQALPGPIAALQAPVTDSDDGRGMIAIHIVMMLIDTDDGTGIIAIHTVHRLGETQPIQAVLTYGHDPTATIVVHIVIVAVDCLASRCQYKHPLLRPMISQGSLQCVL